MRPLWWELVNTKLWPKSSAEGLSTTAPKSESRGTPAPTPVLGSRVDRSTLEVGDTGIRVEGVKSGIKGLT